MLAIKKHHVRRYEARVTFRCSPKMETMLQQAANREELTTSSYARRAMMRQLEADGIVSGTNSSRQKEDGRSVPVVDSIQGHTSDAGPGS